MDTATKRYAAMHLSAPWRSSRPLPDNDLGRADRFMIAGFYGGLPNVLTGAGTAAIVVSITAIPHLTALASGTAAIVLSAAGAGVRVAHGAGAAQIVLSMSGLATTIISGSGSAAIVISATALSSLKSIIASVMFDLESGEVLFVMPDGQHRMDMQGGNMIMVLPNGEALLDITNGDVEMHTRFN